MQKTILEATEPFMKQIQILQQKEDQAFEYTISHIKELYSQHSQNLDSLNSVDYNIIKSLGYLYEYEKYDKDLAVARRAAYEAEQALKNWTWDIKTAISSAIFSSLSILYLSTDSFKWKSKDANNSKDNHIDPKHSTSSPCNILSDWKEFDNFKYIYNCSAPKDNSRPFFMDSEDNYIIVAYLDKDLSCEGSYETPDYIYKFLEARDTTSYPGVSIGQCFALYEEIQD